VRVVENSTDLAVLRGRESKKAAGRNPMTGLVVDSGDGVTHIIPVTALALHCTGTALHWHWHCTGTGTALALALHCTALALHRQLSTTDVCAAVFILLPCQCRIAYDQPSFTQRR
jgi:hypothetical protein